MLFFFLTVANISKTFGAISRSTKGPTDLELRNHRDEALKQTHLEPLSGLLDNFTWFIHLHLFEKSLRNKLFSEGRLSTWLLWTNLIFRFFKWLADILYVLSIIVRQKKTKYTILVSQKGRADSVFLIFNPDHCVFARHYLAGSLGLRILADTEECDKNLVIFEENYTIDFKHFIIFLSLLLEKPYLPARQIKKVLLMKRFIENAL